MQPVPLAVFIFVCSVWVQHIRGCRWVVIVVAPHGQARVAGGGGLGLAVSVLMVAQWWHLSARFFRLVSRLTSCFLALFCSGLKVPHWKGQTLTTVCLTACNSCSEGDQHTTQQAWPRDTLPGPPHLHARVCRRSKIFVLCYFRGVFTCTLAF